MKSYKIGYKEQLGPFLSNYIVIEFDGSIILIQQYSEKDMPIRSIGKYFVPAKYFENDIYELLEIIETNKILKLEDTILPFERFFIKKTLIIQENDVIGLHEFVLGDPFPPNLLILYDKIYNIIKKTNLYPSSTMHIEVKSKKRNAKIMDNLNLELSYINNGDQEVRFLNPRKSSNNENNFLFLRAWLVNYKKEQIISPEELSFTINLGNIEHRRDKFSVIPSDLEFILLKPGERLDYFVEFNIPKCKQGNYLFEIVYNSFSDTEPIGNIIEGEYHSDPINFYLQ